MSWKFLHRIVLVGEETMEHFRCKFLKRGMLVLLIFTAVLLMMMEGTHGISKPDTPRTNISGSGSLPGPGSGSGSNLEGMQTCNSI